MLAVAFAPTERASAEQPAPAAPCSLRDPFVALREELARRYPRHRIAAAASDGDCLYLLDPHLRVTTASVVKLELMAGVLLRAQRAGRGLSEHERSEIRPMITESANPPASRLFKSLGGARGLEGVDREFGLVDTRHPGSTWGLAETSVSDQIHLIRGVVPGHVGPLDAAHRAEARAFLTSVVPSQRWGASTAVPAGWVVSQKNGFAPSRCCRWRLNTVGWIERPDGTGWAMTVLSDGWPTQAAGIAAVELVSARINTAMTAAPFGHLDAATRVGATEVHVRGWAADASDTSPRTVHLYADGRFVGSTVADGTRADVAQLHPGHGELHGLDVTVAVGRATRLCAYAINGGPPAPNSLLGCRDF